jgi:HEXXH motif-containing protein
LTELDNSFERRFDELPLPSKSRIVESPDVYNQITQYVRNQSNTLQNLLEQSIRVEELRNGLHLHPCAGKWSANGDFLFDDVLEEKRDEAGWRIRGRFSAPLLGNKIPLDHHSPFARHPMPVAEFRSVQFGTAEPMTAKEEQCAITLVRRSFSKINSALPEAADFIGRCVNSIILRKTSSTGKIFQSASRNAFIGQIVLLNPHHDHVDDEDMAESLIHESIHALLWRAEILDHFLLNPNMEMGIVRSPWSGERIVYYTLLQACFVWYGIFWFWDAVTRSKSEFYPNRAIRLRDRARAGFHKEEYIMSLEQNCRNLKPGVFEVFKELREIVISAV